MSDNRLSILYCDDQPEFRSNFEARHGKRFSIQSVDDVSEVREKLEECSKLPDVLLLDLYHDIDTSKVDQAERVAEAKAALEELDAVVRRVKDKVDRAWQPAGLRTLESVRERFSARDLPVVIYTQRGLVFFDEEEMRSVEEAAAHWMLKDKGEHYEAERIQRVVAERPGRRPARDVTIAALSGIVFFAIPEALRLIT